MDIHMGLQGVFSFEFFKTNRAGMPPGMSAFLVYMTTVGGLVSV